MAYQRLQACKAWQVYKSDNTDFPNIGVGGATAANT